jgi:hypothetical protein
MKPLFFIFAVIVLTPSEVVAVAPPPCLGGVSVSTFRLLLQPEGKGPALPLNAVNIIRPGEKLKYEPIHVPAPIRDKAQIAILLVPAPTRSGEEANEVKGKDNGNENEKAKDEGKDNSKEKQKDLVVLEARPAKSPAEWVIPTRASIVGVVFGPRGLDVKKVSSMVEKNEELIPQLADYAQQTATVEALVQTLSQVEQSPTPGTDLNAALRGFSVAYGLAVPKLDTAAPTDQQAAQLLQAVLPSLSTYDPLTSDRSAVVAQSMGLASSVAALFFGTPVGLAAGGAALFENLRIMVFPDTDFHAAFTQSVPSNELALCSKDQKLKPRTRPAYLWMLRVPDVGAPAASLPETRCLPLGWKSTIKIACANPSQLKNLPRVRDWELVSSGHSAEIPVTVKLGEPDDALELDLSKTKLPEGQYRLVAKWDWDPVEVQGDINLRPFADFSHAKLSPDSEDRLVEGTGLVRIRLTGADFEFVNKVTLVPSGGAASLSPAPAALKDGAASEVSAAPTDGATLKTGGFPKELSFTVPKAEGAGEQTSLEVGIDTAGLPPGAYLLKLTQTNGSIHDFRIVLHPPNPTLSNLPLRANLGETQQTFALEGTGLERVEGISSEGATWALAPVASDTQNVRERKATIKLLPKVKKGETLDASLKVSELHTPLKIFDVVQVVGPRPKITGASEFTSQTTDVALRQGEIAAGGPLSFAIQTENAGSHPTFDLSCANQGDVKKSLSLHPGDRIGTAQLDFAGEGILFLSVDPGSVGRSGCQLQATVTVDETGASEPYTLGRVIRLPHIEKFVLTDQKKGSDLFLGSLTGQELQTIEKTGWDGQAGYPVQGIPVPAAGDPQEQTLQIELPWPPPSPRAPLYVWLRGESQGRVTEAKY